MLNQRQIKLVTLAVKICGIKSPNAMDMAIEMGARYLGFVFEPRSRRHITVNLAWELAKRTSSGVRNVGLFVDPSDEDLSTVLNKVPLDFLQLHGDETPHRIKEIKAQYPHKIIKAVSVSEKSDLDIIDNYRGIVDIILLDTKPMNAEQIRNLYKLPGGNGIPFDWSILSDYDWRGQDWMLSGGISKDNLKTALEMTGATAIDLSSSLEDRPGQKNPEKIKEFMQAVQKLS